MWACVRMRNMRMRNMRQKKDIKAEHFFGDSIKFDRPAFLETSIYLTI